jgi:ABC-type sugar transport system ATPase subunit
VAKAIDLGIAPAFQQPQFCENLDVSANIFLGREMRQGFASRDDEGMYNKAREVLNTLSTSVRAGQSIASLSGRTAPDHRHRAHAAQRSEPHRA